MADDVWRPLSERNSHDSDWDKPVEGVPPWLYKARFDWIDEVIWNEYSRQFDRDLLVAIEVNLRVQLSWGSSKDPVASIRRMAADDPQRFLDVLDFLLKAAANDHLSRRLAVFLGAGGSAWTVAPDGKGLARRVLTETERAAKDIIDSGSAASRLIASAWHHVMGRNPNYGAGYRDAVKAVEAAACPVAIPKNERPTLGQAIVALQNARPETFATVFPSTALDGKPLESIEPVAKVMQLIWRGEVERHAPASDDVPLNATREQAEATLFAAVMLVQWFLRGFVSRRSQ